MNCSPRRTLPHRPDPGTLQKLQESAQTLIRQRESNRIPEFSDQNAEYFAKLANLRFIQGMVGYLFDRPLPAVADEIRRGLREIRTAFRFGHECNAWEMWNYLTFALSISARSLADFIASVPDETWWDDTIKPVPWLVLQVQAAIALLHDGPEAAPLLHDLHVEVFETELPIELHKDLPWIQSTHALLDALQRKDSKQFNHTLQARLEIRARAYSEENTAAPIALLDLHSLGLCRLALDRGIEIHVHHPYVPLELLETT